MGWINILRSQGAQITHLTSDSRAVREGSLFLAYPGESVDGRRFIPQAIQSGAKAVLWESNEFAWDDRWQVANHPVSGLKKEAGHVADEFYGSPSRHLWMTGVTGTNGKTSCSHWIAQALSHQGRKTGVVGTLGNGFPHRLSSAKNTTPDSVLLHGMLADMLEEGADGVAMEVSSHGLEQGRLAGVRFDVAVFTNLSRDHLDYHGTMEAYAAAKRKLFAWEGLRFAVVNADDAQGQVIIQELKARRNDCEVLSYGLHSGDVRATNIVMNDTGITFDVIGSINLSRIQVPVVGQFNLYNVLAVLLVLISSGLTEEQAKAGLAAISPVSGRMESFGGGEKPLVVIDYAHTPDALEKALKALRGQVHGQLVCVFGCGGDRDTGKRPLMARIACELADNVVMTSDNPRSENPSEILKQMEVGALGKYQVIEDRELAIQTAIRHASIGDGVLVAGKGHETYQEIAGVRHPFSDITVSKMALEQWL